jgi:hypothetical protein
LACSLSGFSGLGLKLRKLRRHRRIAPGQLLDRHILGLIVREAQIAVRTDQRILLKIQNVGTKPIHLQDIVINDRKDCRFVNATPRGNILNVGDSILLVSECEAVRVTITTDDGPSTYEISR